MRDLWQKWRARFFRLFRAPIKLREPWPRFLVEGDYYETARGQKVTIVDGVWKVG